MNKFKITIFFGTFILLGSSFTYGAQLKLASCEKKGIILKAIYRDHTEDPVTHKIIPRDQESDLLPDWSEASGEIIALKKIPEDINSLQLVYYDKFNKDLIHKVLAVKKNEIEITNWSSYIGDEQSRLGKLVFTLVKKEKAYCEISTNIHYADAQK